MDKITPPTEANADKVLNGIKALSGTVPVIGSLIPWLIDIVVKPPLLKRHDAWMRIVSTSINDLNKSIDELQNNPRFITILIQATQIAVRNHEEEKLNALHNAVINSIQTPNYPETQQVLFLNYIDGFTEWHILILKFFVNENWLSNSLKGGYGNGKETTLKILQGHYPFLKEHANLMELILDELKATKLIHTEWDSINATVINRSASVPFITSLGKDFLSLIESRK